MGRPAAELGAMTPEMCAERASGGMVSVALNMCQTSLSCDKREGDLNIDLVRRGHHALLAGSKCACIVWDVDVEEEQPVGEDSDSSKKLG